MIELIHHRGQDECAEFFSHYLDSTRKTLFIGTLGFNPICLYFPRMLSQLTAIDFVFLEEMRPETPVLLEEAANNNKLTLASLLSKAPDYQPVAIIADDTAVIAGRSAIAVISNYLNKGYQDVIVDASSMTRGVCFPIVKYAFQTNLNTHVVISESDRKYFEVKPTIKDRPMYMHGFQQDMGSDAANNAIKLWLPQLSEKNKHSLELNFAELKPDEVAPIIPFPSADPKRGDRLIREFCDLIMSPEWSVNLLDMIFAHESDPNDVFETIRRIHFCREEALSSGSNSPRTILSPTGDKMGSLGILFAALDLDLPIMYTETTGYSAKPVPESDSEGKESVKLWHTWLKELA